MGSESTVYNLESPVACFPPLGKGIGCPVLMTDSEYGSGAMDLVVDGAVGGSLGFFVGGVSRGSSASVFGSIGHPLAAACCV